MDISRAAAYFEIASFFPGMYSAYVLWTERSAVSSTSFTFAMGAFVALLSVGALLGWLSLREARASKRDKAPDPSEVLAHYYMLLTLLRETIQQKIELEEISGKPFTVGYHQDEVRLEKYQRELMNLSPAVFPTATAMDFQRSPRPEGSVDAKDRLPAAIDGLMKQVLRHWHRYYDERKAGANHAKKSEV